jgi:hypothetical protein
LIRHDDAELLLNVSCRNQGIAPQICQPGVLSTKAIFRHPLGGSALSCEVIRILSAVSVDINQCKAVLAENASVAVGTVGEISKRHPVHRSFFGVKAVLVSGREEERRTALQDAGYICNRPNRILGIQMEHDTPCNRSIEQSIGERARLNDSLTAKASGQFCL